MTDSVWPCSASAAGRHSEIKTLALGLGFLLAVASSDSRAATFVVTNVNAPGQGFNDPTPVAPVTGNPATTLGAQRMAVFQAAADSWGVLLQSPVNIVVSAQMTSLSCEASSGTLGSAGAANIARNFQGAPVADIWYPIALANALRGSDLSPGNHDINANFNQDIGKPNCLQSLSWSYVIGAPAPAGTISFFDTVVHEVGHGLGVFSLVDNQSGELLSGFSDSYTQYLLDETPAPALWTSMTNGERAASAIDNGNLTWNGGSVNAVAGLLTAGRHGSSSRVRMYAPNPLRPGSSVSHFDIALSPNDIMEPSLTSINRRRLANHLLLDLGWKAFVNLVVSKTDGEASRVAGTATSYTITVQNNSVADISAVNLGVTDNMPAALQDTTWSCAGSAGGNCAAANGSGSINTTITVPQGGSVSFTINATIDAAFLGTLSNTVNLSLPANLQNQSASTATDNTTVTSPVNPGSFTVSPISGNTSETGTTATFSVVLNREPTANVSTNLNSNDSTEGTITQGNLVFTAGNWNIPQVVTVTGVDDPIDDGNIQFLVVTSAATSADGGYQGVNPADVGVTNLDNDTAGITVSSISGDTNEAGQGASFTVVLQTQPVNPVTINIQSGDLSEGTVDKPSLVFNNANWNTAQQVTVTGQDDDVDDGDINYSIVTAAATSADPPYQGLDAADVAVTNLDDDTAGIEISEVSGNTMETGVSSLFATATFTIELDSEPTADVSISLSSSDVTEGQVSPGIVTFTPATWFESKLVTITAQDDAEEDGDIAYSIITAAATSADPKYSGLDSPDVNLLNRDDENELIFQGGFEPQ